MDIVNGKKMKVYPEIYLIIQYTSDKVKSECYKDSFISDDFQGVMDNVFKYPYAAKYVVLTTTDGEIYTYQNSKRKITIGIEREDGEITPVYSKYTDFEYLISRQEMIDNLED